jgi:hypothetical protein
MRRRLAAGTLFMLLVGACGPRAPAPTMMRQHPEFAARTAARSRLAILPPRVRIWEMGFNDDETRLRDAEHQLESELTQLIGAKLSAHHFTLLPARLDAADVERQRALRFQLSELFQSYDQLSWKVYRKGAQPPETARQCHATMGPAINPFADRAAADALLFVDVEGATKSAGLRGKDTFFMVLAALGGSVYMPPAAGAILEVALIDGTTGELLWSNRIAATFRRPLDPAFLVNLAFNEFPSGAGAATVAASTPDTPR